ncbi:Ankyrin repeat domain-containing protein 16 [Phlyctochytrium planicorne]|nr:Ankyrin repeat domain-containing protein 16 [Phlyctochytrium planicorne]
MLSASIYPHRVILQACVTGNIPVLERTLRAAESSYTTRKTKWTPPIPEILSTRSKSGETPLHYAIERGDLPVCRMLLDAGANPHLQKLEDVTMEVVYNDGDEELTEEEFRERHPDWPQSKKPRLDMDALAADPEDRKVLEALEKVEFLKPDVREEQTVSTCIHSAFDTSHHTIAKLLFQNYLEQQSPLPSYAPEKVLSQLVSAFNGTLDASSYTSKKILSNASSTFETVVHYAALGGQTKLVRDLINVGGGKSKNSISTMQNVRGDTTLHFASTLGYIDIVKEFASQPKVLKMTNKGKQNALHVASQSSEDASVIVPVVELLIASGLDPMVKDGDGRSSVLLAAKAGSVEVFKALIAKAGQKWSAQKDVDGSGKNVLTVAGEWGRLELLKYLIDEMKVDPFLVDKNGVSAFMSAARFNRVEVLEYYVGKFPKKVTDLVGTKDKEGETALDLAVKETSEDAVEFLCARGASVDAPYLIQTAVDTGSFQIVSSLINQGISLDLSDPDAADDDEPFSTPFEIAMENGDDHIAELLLPKTDLAAMTTVNAKLAFIIAVKKGNLAIANALMVQHKDALLRMGWDDGTPLTDAVESGVLGMVEAVVGWFGKDFVRKSRKSDGANAVDVASGIDAPWGKGVVDFLATLR